MASSSLVLRLPSPSRLLSLSLRRVLLSIARRLSFPPTPKPTSRRSTTLFGITRLLEFAELRPIPLESRHAALLPRDPSAAPSLQRILRD